MKDLSNKGGGVSIIGFQRQIAGLCIVISIVVSLKTWNRAGNWPELPGIVQILESSVVTFALHRLPLRLRAGAFSHGFMCLAEPFLEDTILFSLCRSWHLLQNHQITNHASCRMLMKLWNLRSRARSNVRKIEIHKETRRWGLTLSLSRDRLVTLMNTGARAWEERMFKRAGVGRAMGPHSSLLHYTVASSNWLARNYPLHHIWTHLKAVFQCDCLLLFCWSNLLTHPIPSSFLRQRSRECHALFKRTFKHMLEGVLNIWWYCSILALAG